MRKEIEAYVVELDNEIDRCYTWLEEHLSSEAHIVSEMEGRIKALMDVKNDLQDRLDNATFVMR